MADVNGRIVLGATTRNLDASDAENVIAAARRDGVIVTDAASSPLQFTLVLDGVNVPVSIDPNETLVNATPEELRAQIQKKVDDAVVAAGVGVAGDFKVVFDGLGNIRFMKSYTLACTTDAENALAAAQTGFNVNAPVDLTLVYNGTAITVSIPAGANADADALRTVVQNAIDASLAAVPGLGLPGSIVARVDPSGHVTFALKDHTLADTSSIETQIAEARRAGHLVTPGGAPWCST